MNLVSFPDKRLREKCEPVIDIDAAKLNLTSMAKRMVEWSGIGLAAPQCGIMERMFVAIIAGKIQSFINPTIEDLHENFATMPEGCLSIPGVTVEVTRPNSVLIHAQNERGKEFNLECRGLEARCVQHELDHIDGILMIDRLNRYPYRMAMQAIWDVRVRR